MESSPSSDLSLDCKQHHSSYSMKLEQYLSCLEQEKTKIDAFKRELPLCMQLLANAVEKSREQLKNYKGSNEGEIKPILEEFIPIKNSNSESLEKSSDKANWMTSAQLWSQASDETKHQSTKSDNESEFQVMTQLDLEKDEENGNATHRKPRRCWSPELHRRFVNALHMLGGSQAATPKQIRELMKVEGLTNDEVKSHLQKYRLHTRRPSPNPQATGPPGPQLVVLGGIWVPSEYATSVHSNSHVTTPHYYASPMPQDLYHIAPAPPPSQLPSHHHHLQLYTASKKHDSSESDHGELGDRSESIEDRNSESSSWKGGDSGEKGDGKMFRGEKAMEVNSLFSN